MSEAKPIATDSPAPYHSEETPLDVPPTPDSVASDDNVGRRAQRVNGAVVGSGAGAGGGGGPEDFDYDEGGGAPLPNQHAVRKAEAGITTGSNDA